MNKEIDNNELFKVISFEDEDELEDINKIKKIISDFLEIEPLYTLVFDITKLTYISSSGIANIAKTAVIVYDKNKKLIVVSDNRIIKNLIKLADLNRMIDFFPDMNSIKI
jgi:anti-anti-sigma factor